MEPRIWSTEEVVALIEKSLKECKEDCIRRGVAFSWHEGAENVYCDLSRECLIEHQP